MTAGLRDRLTAVLGASAAPGDHLVRHPEDWQVLRGPDALRSPAAAELRADLLHGGGRQARRSGAGRRPAAAQNGNPAAALPAAYRRRLLHLAARDLTGAVTVDETAAELADSPPRPSRRRWPSPGPSCPRVRLPPGWR